VDSTIFAITNYIAGPALFIIRAVAVVVAVVVVTVVELLPKVATLGRCTGVVGAITVAVTVLLLQKKSRGTDVVAAKVGTAREFCIRSALSRLVSLDNECIIFCHC
jgi:hypothetical protein